MLKTHQHIQKYLQENRKARFVGRLVLGVVLGLLFLAITLGVNVTGAQAHERTICQKSDRTYIVVWGDTLSKIAYRYHTTWPVLASYNRILDANLIYVDQTVCIPAHGSFSSTQVQSQRSITTYKAPVQAQRSITTYKAPVQAQKSAPAYKASVQQSGAQARVQHTTVPAYSAPPQVRVQKRVPTYNNPPQTQYNASGIPGMIDQVFGAYGPAAINVARCESGLNPNAYNPSGASGLFQILPSTWSGTSEAGMSPFNAEANIIAAHQIFVRDGYSWREWVCQP